MAQAEFKKGDYVVYPAHGVGEVQAIEKQTFGDQELELVVVKFEKNRMTLRIPLDKVDISGLRKLSSKKEMDKIVGIIKEAPQSKRMIWSRRAQMYEDKINSGNPENVAEVVRDLYRNVKKDEQSFSERQIYQKALERLSSEYATIMKLDLDKANLKLEKVMENSPERQVSEESSEETLEDEL
ncbi:MAG: CarD family transcriptional regulator [Alphaproteobacteria bacterium]|nr:CarD family transcriptional regulator [Alphaproteobacteria bacterium]